MIWEFKGLEEGESDQRDSGPAGFCALLPRSHQFLLEDTTTFVRQCDSIGSVAVVSDTFLDLDVKSWIAFNSHDHRQCIADLNKTVHTWCERSLANLDIHAGRGRITAETDDLSVQHVNVESIGDRLFKTSFPEATNGSRSIPDLFESIKNSSIDYYLNFLFHTDSV